MNRRRVSISGFLLSFFPFLYDFSPERCRSVRKGANVAVPCVGPFFVLWQNWDCAVLRGAIFSLRPPVAISCFLRFFLPRSAGNDLRWPHLSLFEERYRRKTRQRAPKPPFGFWLFIRGFGGETCGLFYEFTRVQLTRFRPVRGVLRTASTDSIVLRVLRRIRNIYRITIVV